MEVLSIGTKVKIKDMNDAIGYIDTISILAEDRVRYHIVYYNKNTGEWNKVVLPEVAFTIHKSNQNREKTKIGF
jgi:hypothetical protein